MAVKTRKPMRALKKPTAAKPPRKPTIKLTTEQQARLDAFEEMVAKRQREWDALTPEQQKEEHDGWKRAMNRMNEDRRNSGQRLLFPDGIE